MVEQLEHYWYELRCEVCKTIESAPGPKRHSTTWHEFALMLKKSNSYDYQYRYCPVCKRYTRQILVSFDAE
jgi:hypothetical protein